jgi:hypothetical protein
VRRKNSSTAVRAAIFTRKSTEEGLETYVLGRTPRMLQSTGSCIPGLSVYVTINFTRSPWDRRRSRRRWRLLHIW